MAFYTSGLFICVTDLYYFSFLAVHVFALDSSML
jgi:hypothetical protein